ncbi:E3 ubiquitin-protein ligase rnf8-like isoform X3 [Gouania willdenowi]|uniref:E3 ubiquitin-protein ligase CHFR n=1 Tax=Gouania willdenowi TaxID=441366 RepID=A0A8C5HMD3_GOUWI|nr:dynein regulatory complex subunit 5 isoform X3 [Gouania willdenowi]
MEETTTGSGAAGVDSCSLSEFYCLMRVGQNSDWLCLAENASTSLGRGVDVSYQLLSPSCPLMISRLHCVFHLREGQCTVEDKKTLNGVWVNGSRIPAHRPYKLKLGDSVQLGVPVNGNKVEFDYVFERRPLTDFKFCLPKRHTEKTLSHGNSKRKLTTEELEASTSKPKLYRCSTGDKSLAQPCPLSVKDVRRLDKIAALKEDEATCDQDNLQTYSQNLLVLRAQVDDTQRQVAALEGEPPRGNPLKEEQVRELQDQLKMLREKMQRMGALERSFSETQRQLEEQKTQQQEELLKKQLEDALQEQQKVMDELCHSRRGFEEILSAKKKELEVTKEEKEKARAQKEEVVTHVTEVLENELQCIICSELLIEAVTLGCSHSFCKYCIQQWRKKKDECPICRQAIQSQTRCLALDNCIDGMVDNLSLDMKTRRETLISERRGQALYR